jgi:hypothetical protein
MEIQIEPTSSDDFARLLKSKRPEGIDILPFPRKLEYGPPIDLTTLFVTLAASVPVGLFINWLSQYLIDKPSTKITINRKEIYYDEGEITRMIEETRVIEQGKIQNK